MNQYLIPANSKRGLLIFGIFNVADLIIFGIGLGVTFLLLMIFPQTQLGWTILEILPALVAVTLVTPMGNYHNTLTLLRCIFDFASTEQKLEWRGWEHEREYGERKKKK